MGRAGGRYEAPIKYDSVSYPDGFGNPNYPCGGSPPCSKLRPDRPGVFQGTPVYECSFLDGTDGWADGQPDFVDPSGMPYLGGPILTEPIVAPLIVSSKLWDGRELQDWLSSYYAAATLPSLYLDEIKAYNDNIRRKWGRAAEFRSGSSRQPILVSQAEQNDAYNDNFGHTLDENMAPQYCDYSQKAGESCIDNFQIEQLIKFNIHKGKLPRPSPGLVPGHTIYAVHLPPKMKVRNHQFKDSWGDVCQSSSGNQASGEPLPYKPRYSCLDFCGYHSSFLVEPETSGAPQMHAHYYVVPDMRNSGCAGARCGDVNDAPGKSDWVKDTSVTSMALLIKTITNPAVYAVRGRKSHKLGIYNHAEGEITDPCKTAHEVLLGDGTKKWVPALWSQRECMCVAPSGVPCYVSGDDCSTV